jgi:hypothetical protein
MDKKQPGKILQGKTVVMSTACLPPPEYFASMAAAREVLIDIHEHYVKQTFRNRYSIYSANGKLDLVIPVIKTLGNHTPVKDVRISAQPDWQRIHWCSIESACLKTPFFLYYRDCFEPFYHKKHHFLLDFNTEILLSCLAQLGMERKVKYTENYLPHYPEDLYQDLRNAIVPKRRRRQGPVPFKPFPYTQAFGERFGFIPGLSILDLIFNTGPEAGAYVLRMVDS